MEKTKNPQFGSWGENKDPIKEKKFISLKKSLSLEEEKESINSLVIKNLDGTINEIRTTELKNLSKNKGIIFIK